MKNSRNWSGTRSGGKRNWYFHRNRVNLIVAEFGTFQYFPNLNCTTVAACFPGTAVSYSPSTERLTRPAKFRNSAEFLSLRIATYLVDVKLIVMRKYSEKEKQKINLCR